MAQTNTFNRETYVICKRLNIKKAYDINTHQFELATPSIIETEEMAKMIKAEDIGDDPCSLVIIMARSEWEKQREC